MSLMLHDKLSKKASSGPSFALIFGKKFSEIVVGVVLLVRGVYIYLSFSWFDLDG